MRHSIVTKEANARIRARKHGCKFVKVDYQSILDSCGEVCHICKGPIESRADLVFDHVIPLVKKGPHSPENIRPAHYVCNRAKNRKILTP